MDSTNGLFQIHPPALIEGYTEFRSDSHAGIYSMLVCEQAPGEPDSFALRILLFRARRIFFPSSPGACSQANSTLKSEWVFFYPM